MRQNTKRKSIRACTAAHSAHSAHRHAHLRQPNTRERTHVVRWCYRVLCVCAVVVVVWLLLPPLILFVFEDFFHLYIFRCSACVCVDCMASRGGGEPCTNFVTACMSECVCVYFRKPAHTRAHACGSESRWDVYVCVCLRARVLYADGFEGGRVRRRRRR